ncbi:hypothetical protein SAMN05661086_01520 [Anaeromicropila populeti]|uniref:DUF6870 domain-containing protein n=2 Tax=Anaeromicropila populeti TaxID=37658 RepID=A0A1I6JCB4_9FIRM|nr:hypothetical protein SAMN05661086_01520 [Anaeromicropila populeti]
MDYESMKNIDIQKVDPDSLVDLLEVEIDETLSIDERIKSFIEQIKNPYCFKVGEVVVKIKYADTDVTLEQKIAQILESSF